MSTARKAPAPRPARPRLPLAVAVAAAGLLPAVAWPQAMQPSFAVIGEIEAFSLATPADPLSAATITVGNIPITIPTSIEIVMPGKYATAQQLFQDAHGAQQAASGLALSDPTPPPTAFEADIIGNITGGQYVAGVVRISQGALHTGAGFIQAIDYATGEIRVGAKDGAVGARVRLNDVKGVYGLRNDEGAKAGIPLDPRFELDSENSPVHAMTGFPVCIPRVDPAAADDTKCPRLNRPSTLATGRFTCAQSVNAAPADPFAPVSPGCDPNWPVPLRKGDYVTYFGNLQKDPAGGFLISAYGLEAALGIYTEPQTDPAYVYIEEAIQGTLGEEFPDIPQEETTRFRVVGFTTDPSRHVEIVLRDTDRNKEASMTDPDGLTPSNGPQLGRFRFTWPSKDNARAVRRDAEARIIGVARQKLPSGLTPGFYTIPIGEYIYPEITRFGVPGWPAPVPFENFCFLSKAQGTMDGHTLGVPSPFPNSGHPTPQQAATGGTVCDSQ